MKTNILLGLLATIALFSSDLSAQEWNYQLEPYLMVTSIKGDATVGRVNEVDVDVDFDTILDNLDAGAMVHFEAHHSSGWGAVIDYGFMDLGGTKTAANNSAANAGVRQGVLELQALYRNQLSNGTLDYFGGIRWWDNDINVDLNFSSLPGDGFEKEVKADWVDIVVGVRWLRQLNPQWTFLAQIDVGGFGIESDFTSSVQSGLQYKINELMTVDLKYKATWVNFEQGHSGEEGYFNYDTITHGTVIGLIFNF